MSKLLPRALDLAILSFAAALFGACLTSVMRTGDIGWVIPIAPYMYEARDFYSQAVVAGLAGVIVLVLADRPARLRQSSSWRLLATFAAALLALYLAPPAPVVFGNTWEPGEAAYVLYLAQWRMVLPIAIAATALRWGLQRVLR